MKKIVSIIGSPREKSMTFQVVDKIISDIKERIEIESVIIKLCEKKINYCMGCESCFYKASSCIQEDDMHYIEKEILSADLVIFASPVYAHNVTGIMKIFIDRISHWLHLMKLSGKYGIVVSVSDSNGNKFVDGYIEKIFEFLGISIIEKFEYYAVKNNYIELYDDKINNICQKLNKDFEVTNYEIKNTIFLTLQAAYLQQYNLILQNIVEKKYCGEAIYWKEKGLLECKNYKEALKKMKL